MELYKKYRPKLLKDLVGQDKALKALEKLVYGNKIPHAVLISGPSGCGKTTVARILKTQVQASDHDFYELNCADCRSIEDIRLIRDRMNYAPMGGRSRMWLIDEAHQLTKDAQNAFLKMLEDTPEHVYFVLATTDPDRLIRTVRNRCTHIKLDPLQDDDVSFLVNRVEKAEGFDLSETVVDAIVEAASNSGRAALVILEQVAELEKEKDQLAAIAKYSTTKDTVTFIGVTLLFNKGWEECVKGLTGIEDQDAEGLRRGILSYMRKVMLSPKTDKYRLDRCFMIIDIFGRNFYDNGHAGLVAACYEVCNPQK